MAFRQMVQLYAAGMVHVLISIPVIVLRVIPATIAKSRHVMEFRH